MPIIKTDITCLRSIVQLGLDHPSSRLFRDPVSISSFSILNDVDVRLAESGEKALVKSLEALEQSIEDVTTLKALLDGWCEETRVSLSHCRAIVAPIRRLPVEILQTIFIFLEHDRIPRNEEAPVASQVCRLWRQVALSTPSLWSTIAVPVNCRRIEENIAHLTLWMERSKARPVALIIGNQVFGPESGRSYVDPGWEAKQRAGELLARAVETHASRLATLVIRHRSSSVVTALVRTWHESTSFSMPNLKAFRVEEFSLEGDDIWDPTQSFLSNKAPNLRQFLSKAPHDRWEWYMFPASDTIQAFRGFMCYDTMRAWAISSNLQVLQLENIYEWDLFEPLRGISSPFQNLSSLHLIMNSIDNSMYIPPLAALRYLIITHDTCPYDRPLNILHMLRVWGHQLLYLSILVDTSDTPFADFEGCLAAVPNLEGLRVGISDCIDVVQRASLPRLKHCEFHLEVLLVESFINLRKFSACAFATFPRLQPLSVAYHTAYPPSEDVQWFRLGVATRPLKWERVEVFMYYVGMFQSGSLDDFKFDGAYFYDIGGIFGDLYSLDEYDLPLSRYLNG